MVFQRFKKISICFLLTTLIFGCGIQKKKDIDLSGIWNFKIDSLDAGIPEKWFSQDLSENIQLPGSMTINGKGSPVSYHTQWTGSIWANRDSGKTWLDDPNYKPYVHHGEVLFPYWLIADKYYTGAAWYQKEIDIPADWDGKSIELFMERCH